MSFIYLQPIVRDFRTDYILNLHMALRDQVYGALMLSSLQSNRTWQTVPSESCSVGFHTISKRQIDDITLYLKSSNSPSSF